MDIDAIDVKTAFRVGFVARCHEEGLSEKEAAERLTFLEKQSVAPIVPWLIAGGMALKDVIGGAYSGAKTLINEAKAPMAVLAGVPVGLGLAGGAAAGYGAAKLTEPDIDEDDIKAQELAQTYRVYTDRLKARQAYQQYRRAQGI